MLCWKNDSAAAIREIAAQFSLSQGVIADLLGVSPNAVSKWMRGASKMPPGLFELLCHKLEVDPAPWLSINDPVIPTRGRSESATLKEVTRIRRELDELTAGVASPGERVLANALLATGLQPAARYNSRQTRALLNVAYSTLVKLGASGALVPMKIGRISWWGHDALVAYLDARNADE